MKVKIKESKKVKEKPFPKLMIHTDSTIVLFSDSEKGICIRAGGRTIFGYQTEDFFMSSFKDFEGSITLSND